MAVIKEHEIKNIFREFVDVEKSEPEVTYGQRGGFVFRITPLENGKFWLHVLNVSADSRLSEYQQSFKSRREAQEWARSLLIERKPSRVARKQSV